MGDLADMFTQTRGIRILTCMDQRLVRTMLILVVSSIGKFLLF